MVSDIGRTLQTPYAISVSKDHNDQQILAVQRLLEEHFDQTTRTRNWRAGWMSRRTTTPVQRARRYTADLSAAVRGNKTSLIALNR
jgi:hypothetical protein